MGAATATLDIAGAALLPGAWPILRGALGPVLERLRETLGGEDPTASTEAAERAADEFERDARLQELLRGGLLDALDPIVKSQDRIEHDVQALCVMVMENTKALDRIADDVGDIRERLVQGVELSEPAEGRLANAVAERLVVMQQVGTFAAQELQIGSDRPGKPEPWLERQQLMTRAYEAQLTAIDELRAGQPSSAMERLGRARIVLSRALAETPTDPQVRLLNGYVLKTLAQVSGETGDPAAAADYLTRAERIFKLVVADLPADEHSVTELAGAINGLGNVLHERHQYEQAIECYWQATELAPTYAYAWHDLYAACDALARQGDIRIEELERSYTQLRAVAAGYPKLEPHYLDQLGAQLEAWKRRAATRAG
ncbi:MAG: tetratricopeptide repeat protein [Thermoleophilaceae bacterium]